MQTSNFAFLHDLFPVLENFGSLAEQYVYTDPNSCLLKLGMIGETIVRLIYQYDNLPLPYDDTAAARINDLYRDDSIVDYDDLPDPIESGEEAIAQLEEAIDLLQSVVNELKSLQKEN